MNDNMKEILIEQLVFKEDEHENLGYNETAVAALIKFLSSLNMDDKNIACFVNNFDKLKISKENFKVFESKQGKSFYMHTFKVLNVNKDDDNYVLAHEIGHAILNVYSDTVCPDNFKDILEESKKSFVAADHLDLEFDHKIFTNAKPKTILQYMEHKKSEDIDGLGPFADMISSTFQCSGFALADKSALMLPYNHSKEYYIKDGEINYKLIYDEQFANFFSLYINGNKDNLNILKQFLGNNWYQFMMNKVNEIINQMSNVKEEIIDEENIKGSTR